MEKQGFIFYSTVDGKSNVVLFARDGDVWMNQNQLAELFDTSKQNISLHIANVLKDKELDEFLVVKDYLTTASDGKKNYLTADEIDLLNRFVVVFLETAELRAKNAQDITMDFWKKNVDRIIAFNDKEVLNHKGNITHLQMEKKVDAVYEAFHKQRKQLEAQKADEQDLEELKQLEDKLKNKRN